MVVGCIFNIVENWLKICEMIYYRDVLKIKFEMVF